MKFRKLLPYLAGIVGLIFLLGLTVVYAATHGTSPSADDAAVALPMQSQADSAWDCTLPLRVTVRQGPDAGLELFGLVHMNIDDAGSAEGIYEVVAPESHVGEVPLVGQIMGRAVNLMFSLSDETSMFGVGTSHESIVNNCHTEWGGPVVGPGEGDLGDWACTPDLCCSGSFCMSCQLVGSQNQCTKVARGEISS